MRRNETMVKHWLSAITALTLVLVSALGARAQDQKVVTLIAPNIMRGPIEHLIPGFEAKTGLKVMPTFGGVVPTYNTIMKSQGHGFDVMMVEGPYAMDVMTAGAVLPYSETAIANFSIGVAVRKGAPKPNISTTAAVKRMLLAAKSIAYPDPSTGAAAGTMISNFFEDNDVAKQVQAKAKPTKGGRRAMEMVANGEAEVGMTFTPGMADVPGIEVVGPLPDAVLPATVVVGFNASYAKNPAGATQLLKYLTSPAATAAYKAALMRPGSGKESIFP
jgi:molybdate transport system substrate-binding protein